MLQIMGHPPFCPTRDEPSVDPKYAVGKMFRQ
jgi:hypothetical protein